MKTKTHLFDWQSHWFQYWIWGPIAAYYLSWSTGWLTIILFPILLTVVQYLSLKNNAAVSKPHLWLFWMVPTTYLWIKFGPVPPYANSFGVGRGVVNYYAGQVMATVLLMFMVKPAAIYYWILGNVLAALLWYGCYYSPFLLGAPRWLATNFGPATYFFFPAISLLSNAITGYFLYLATRPDPHETT